MKSIERFNLNEISRFVPKRRFYSINHEIESNFEGGLLSSDWARYMRIKNRAIRTCPNNFDEQDLSLLLKANNFSKQVKEDP